MKAFTNANPRDARSRRVDAGAAGRAQGGQHAVVRRRRQRSARADEGSDRRSPTSSSTCKAISGARPGRRRRRRADDRRADHARRARAGTRRSGSSTRCWPRRPASVATPQIRNVGTLAGNVCQRPWCWYFRNGFPCYKNGGNQCFSFAGENQFHAIFGGGPSYIVHPSDTAPALVALDATFRIVGPAGERTVPAADFFALPTAERGAARTCSADDEVLAAVAAAGAAAGHAQHVPQGPRPRGLDARRRQRGGRARDGRRRLPQRARRARRRRADSVAAARGREAAGRAAHHAGAGREGRRSRGGRRAAAGEERLQGAADARRWSARTILEIADRGLAEVD